MGLAEPPDGSWISAVFDSKTDKARRPGTVVRVIECAIEDGREPAGPYRLITTILDPGDWTHAVGELARRQLPKRRPRANPAS